MGIAERYVIYKISLWLWALYHIVLMFDEPLRDSHARIMAKGFDSRLFVPGSHSASSVMETRMIAKKIYDAQCP